MIWWEARELATPGWKWWGYRSWRVTVQGSYRFSPVSYGRRYRVFRHVVRASPRWGSP